MRRHQIRRLRTVRPFARSRRLLRLRCRPLAVSRLVLIAPLPVFSVAVAHGQVDQLGRGSGRPGGHASTGDQAYLPQDTEYLRQIVSCLATICDHGLPGGRAAKYDKLRNTFDRRPF